MIWRFLHNCIAHPLLFILNDAKCAVWFHDYTLDKMPKLYESRWVAYIKLKGKEKHLGYFCHFFDAVCARKSAEDRYGFHTNHGRS